MIPFEERIPVIKGEIAKRRKKWTLTSVSQEDMEQIVMIRVFKKYHLFDESKSEFSHWLNRVITNCLRNILRDNLLRYSRPCITGCTYNLGNEHCGYTKSGKQCSECPLYKKWKSRKESQFNVNQTLTYENHVQEINNMPHDSVDILQSKLIIDAKIKERISSKEYDVYKLLFIENLSPEEVGNRLEYKKQNNSNVPGYQALLSLRKKFIVLAREIIRDELDL